MDISEVTALTIVGGFLSLSLIYACIRCLFSPCRSNAEERGDTMTMICQEQAAAAEDGNDVEDGVYQISGDQVSMSRQQFQRLAQLHNSITLNHYEETVFDNNGYRVPTAAATVPGSSNLLSLNTTVRGVESSRNGLERGRDGRWTSRIHRTPPPSYNSLFPSGQTFRKPD